MRRAECRPAQEHGEPPRPILPGPPSGPPCRTESENGRPHAECRPAQEHENEFVTMYRARRAAAAAAAAAGGGGNGTAAAAPDELAPDSADGVGDHRCATLRPAGRPARNCGRRI